MRLIGTTAAAALLAASAPGVAAPKKPAPDPERQICKSKPVTGSRVARKRECYTAQQWEDMALQDRLMMMTKQFNGDRSEAPAEKDSFISPQ